MNITEIKTRKILPPKDDLTDLLSFVPRLSENMVIAISSKVISICEGSTKSTKIISHEALVDRLADLKLEPVTRSRNDMILTQIGNILVESSGVDVSNANGYYILLPKSPYKTAQTIWSYLKKRDGIKNLGVIITDSHSVPRRKGAEGYSLSSYGFQASHGYKGGLDIFKRHFHFTASDVADSLAAAAVLVMGEGNECTPIAVIDNVPRIDFFSKKISLRRNKYYSWVNPNLDVYGPLLQSKLWKKTRKVYPKNKN